MSVSFQAHADDVFQTLDYPSKKKKGVSLYLQKKSSRYTIIFYNMFDHNFHRELRLLTLKDEASIPASVCHR